MARVWLTAVLTAVALALCGPAGAQARTPCPSEQASATALNAAAVSDAILCLSNQIRASYGLPAFTRDMRLDTASRLHSLDMGLRNFFDHTNPDGLTPGNRATAQGYALGVGENIAAGYASARSVVLGWMASAGHCRNLLSGARDIGIGTAVSTRPYYTQDFGDYFSRPVDETARNACPYTVNLDTIADAPVATPPPTASALPAPAPAPASAQAAAATQRPALSSLALSPRRLRAGRGGRISYTLSVPATVTFSVQKATAGGYRTLSARFTADGVAGPNVVRFGGRLGRRTLGAGRYRLQAVAMDARGESSPLVRSGFVVVGR